MSSGRTGRREAPAGPPSQGASATEYPDVAAADVRAFHRQWLSGVTIITTMVDGQPRGMALNAFASVSLEPPVVLACIAKSASTYEPLLRSGHFAMNLLSADQPEVAARFARSGSSEKFEGLAWHAGRFGSPLIEESCAHLEAAVESRVDAYTHTVLFGRVLEASSSALSPMGYLAGKIFDPRDSAQWQHVITALARKPGEVG